MVGQFADSLKTLLVWEAWRYPSNIYMILEIQFDMTSDWN